MKYLKGGSLRNLNSETTPIGTTIWNLCRRGINHIQQLYRIPRNGMMIFLWEDNNLGNPPLPTLNLLNEIKLWLINKGLLRLADICSWDSNGNWVGWSFPEMPEPLIHHQHLLIIALSGMAPVHRSFKYKWAWGQSGFYSTAHGFSALQTP